MHQIVSIFFILFAIILLGAPLQATAQPPGQATKELTIAYQPFASPAGVVMEVLRRDRLFKQALARQGLTLRMQPVNAGGDAIKAFKQGEVTMTTLGDMPVLELASTMPVTVCAQLKQNYAMVVGPKGLVPKDLKGKRIGNVFASSGHFTLLKVLQSANLTEKDVTLVPMPINQMPEALMKGAIDAFAAWEPTPSLMIANAPDRFTAIGRQNSSSYLVANRPFAEKNPETVRQVAAALLRAMSWLKQESNLNKATRWNLATINSFTVTAPLNRPEEISRVTAGDLAAIRYTPRIAPPARTSGNLPLADELAFLKGVGKISRDVRWEMIQDSFNRDIVEQVLRSANKYELKRYNYE